MSDPKSDYKKLLLEKSGPVTTQILNRPEVHNAVDREISAELNDAVRRVRADRECLVVILRGAGDTFCADDDIKEFIEWRGDESYWQVRGYQETVQMIEDLTPVTIAAVEGVCTGRGLELTLVCDFVIATGTPVGACPRSTGTSSQAGVGRPGWPDSRVAAWRRRST